MKIVCLKNGPYLVTSTDEDGTVKTIALCRCGHSVTKPFCDGKHKVVNLEAEQVEVLDERSSAAERYKLGYSVSVVGRT